jgi:hypothetical protein
MGSSKSLSNVKVQNLITSFDGIRIETVIKDEPRKVTKYHFCHSRPKVRKDVKLMGISKSIIEEMGLDYEGVRNDPETAEYLAGNKLLPNSTVSHLFYQSQSLTTIAAFSSASGQVNWEMEEPIHWANL